MGWATAIARTGMREEYKDAMAMVTEAIKMMTALIMLVTVIWALVIPTPAKAGMSHPNLRSDLVAVAT